MSLTERKRAQRLPGQYDEVRRQVLERDGWQCQCCGRRTNLQVHHQQHRSTGGSHELNNLMTLCTDCHNTVHRRR